MNEPPFLGAPFFVSVYGLPVDGRRYSLIIVLFCSSTASPRMHFIGGGTGPQRILPFRPSTDPEAQNVRRRAKQQGGKEIYYRMLFDEDGGDGDQCACHGKRRLRSLAEILTMEGRKRYRERAYDVDRRADVGVGIECVIARHKPRKTIIPLEFGGAQLLTGREKEINYYRYRISQNNEMHHILKRRYVVYQGIDVHSDQIDEPEKIRYQKELAKRYQIVKRRINRIIAFGAINLFHKKEEKRVDRPIYEQVQMTRLLGAEGAKQKSLQIKLGF